MKRATINIIRKKVHWMDRIFCLVSAFSITHSWFRWCTCWEMRHKSHDGCHNINLDMYHTKSEPQNVVCLVGENGHKFACKVWPLRARSEWTKNALYSSYMITAKACLLASWGIVRSLLKKHIVKSIQEATCWCDSLFTPSIMFRPLSAPRYSL